MASRLVVMPVLPSVTVSEAANLRGKGGSARAVVAKPRQPVHTAPTPQAAPMMNSLRFMVPPRCRHSTGVNQQARFKQSYELDEPVVVLDIATLESLASQQPGSGNATLRPRRIQALRFSNSSSHWPEEN
jgi:hypothetical protein